MGGAVSVVACRPPTPIAAMAPSCILEVGVADRAVSDGSEVELALETEDGGGCDSGGGCWVMPTEGGGPSSAVAADKGVALVADGGRGCCCCCCRMLDEGPTC